MAGLIERRQRFAGGSRVPWHAHRDAYAAVVLAGGYAEAGHGGRRRVEAGDVVVHAPFSAHSDRFDARGAEIVNVPLAIGAGSRLASGRVADPEAVLREISDCPHRAQAVLGARIRVTPGEAELVDLLAAFLDAGLDCSLAEWARAHGAAPRTLRRHFGELYGTSAARYRARARARRAWRRIVSDPTPLPALAYDLGFADQAHMTRAVAALTGAGPRHWRMAV